MPEPRDIVGLSEREYARLVALPLKVSAEVAAQRGHRQLFDDLPVMLALLHLVHGLTEWYWVSSDGSSDRSSWATLSLAPLGACRMALTLAELEESACLTCLQALQAGHALLQRDHVLPAATALTETAWQALQGPDPARADAALTAAAGQAVQAIEHWEDRRSRPRPAAS